MMLQLGTYPLCALTQSWFLFRFFIHTLSLSFHLHSYGCVFVLSLQMRHGSLPMYTRLLSLLFEQPPNHPSQLLSLCMWRVRVMCRVFSLLATDNETEAKTHALTLQRMDASLLNALVHTLSSFLDSVVLFSSSIPDEAQCMKLRQSALSLLLQAAVNLKWDSPDVHRAHGHLPVSAQAREFDGQTPKTLVQLLLYVLSTENEDLDLVWSALTCVRFLELEEDSGFAEVVEAKFHAIAARILHNGESSGDDCF